MTERPILFSGPMVRALLAGTKTQTRRAVKFPLKDKLIGCELAGSEIGEEEAHQLCPYGKPGDRLWVKETHLAWWSLDPTNPEGKRLFSHVAAFKADGYQLESGEKWIPSIHMRRVASRITLEIVSVRVERLQDISEADALAEGIVPHVRGGWHWHPHNPQDLDDWHQFGFKTAALAYEDLWEIINGPGSWAANPWLWVVEFKVIKP